MPPVMGDLWPVIQKCTRLRREERYASFSELRKDLETLHQKHVGPPIHDPQTSRVDLEYWLNLGTSMLVLERQEDALSCFEKAIELDEKHPGAWTSCGRAFARMGRYRQAASCLKKAIKLDPDYGPAWLTKGQILENCGKLMPALRSFGEALRCDPTDQRALIGEAGILAKLCVWDHARSFFDLALALDRQNAFVWQSRGLFFCAEGALNSACLAPIEAGGK